MPKLEYKTIPLQDAKVLGDGNGTLTGYASAWGHIDSYGDTVEKGAYRTYLPKFLANGFLSWSHDWGTMIGTPSAAKEDNEGLFLTAEFHSTAQAQQARTIAAERLARGKSMGLSIGYYPHKWAFEDAGDGKDQVRVLQEIELYEVSLVAVPADSFAQTVAVKSGERLWLPFKKTADPDADAVEEEVDPDTHERYAEQGERVLLAVAEYVTRSAEVRELRRKSGRVLSEANRRRFGAMRDQLSQLTSDLEDLLSSVDKEPEPKSEPVPAKAATPVDALFDLYQQSAASVGLVYPKRELEYAQ